MSSKPDAGLRKLLRDNLKPHGLWFQAIETGSTTAGIPDSHVLGPTGTLWVECKRTDGYAVKFEPHQIMWYRKHSPWVRTFIAVRTMGKGSSGGMGDGLALYVGEAVDALDRGGTEAASSVLRFRGRPRSWDWAALARVLIGD